MAESSRWLLNNQWLRWAAGIVAGAAAFIVWEDILAVHVRVSATLPGALISLAGFAMAGAAILVAMRDHGQLRKVSTHLPAAWNAILAQFFRAARYSLAASVYFLLSGDMSGVTSLWLLRPVAVASTFLLSLVLVQALLAVLTLELASKLGASATETTNATPPRRSYDWDPGTSRLEVMEAPPGTSEGDHSDGS